MAVPFDQTYGPNYIDHTPSCLTIYLLHGAI